MTDGFRAKTPLAGVIAVASLLLAAPACADVPAAATRLAQDGPVRLMPRRDGSRPPPPAAAQPESGTSSEGEATPPEIQVRDLGTVDPEAVGTLDAGTGGFRADMWAGTPRATIRRLIGAIPADIRSPVMRGLAERLLLTAAALPPAAGNVDDDKAAPSVLALRAQRLQQMGRVDAAKALILSSSLRTRDLELMHLLVDNRLLANDLGGACAAARSVPTLPETPYWQRVAIFCQLLSGDTEAALLGANILAEMPGFEDRAFLTLVDMLAQQNATPIESLPAPDALHLAMLRSVNARVPDDAVDGAAPVVLRAIGVSPNADLDLRLRAAERAALAGAIGPKRLGQIYMSIEFSDAELKTALSTAAENWTPRGRALLYRAARMQTVPTAQAAVLQKAFELARTDGQLLLLVQLYRDILKDIPVSADLAWFAGDAAKGLLALGEPEAARPWLTLLGERRQRDQDARAAGDRLWALTVLAGDDRYSVDDRERMEAWLAALREAEPDIAYDQAGFALVLMQAVGHRVPDAYWEPLLQPSKGLPVVVPPPAFIPALESAVHGQRLGETVLLSILMIGQEGTLGADAALLRDVIAALRVVGLEREGRALALEAALMNGV